MVKKSLLLTVLIAGVALPAGSDPAGFVFWKSAQLKAYAKQLSPKINAQKVALERLATYDNHLIMVVHREGDGEAEFHETQTDVFVGISGTATLVVGGTIRDGRNTGPGEIRGAGIEGGTRRSMGPGDVANIPSKTAHQVLLDGSKQVTYAIVKVSD